MHPDPYTHHAQRQMGTHRNVQHAQPQSHRDTLTHTYTGAQSGTRHTHKETT